MVINVRLMNFIVERVVVTVAGNVQGLAMWRVFEANLSWSLSFRN